MGAEAQGYRSVIRRKEAATHLQAATLVAWCPERIDRNSIIPRRRA